MNETLKKIYDDIVCYQKETVEAGWRIDREIKDGLARPHSTLLIWNGFTSRLSAMCSCVIPTACRRSFIFKPIALKSKSVMTILLSRTMT